MDMLDILGAVTLPKQDKIVFICKYNPRYFEWNDICCLLDECHTEESVMERTMTCIAVEELDDIPNCSSPAGIACFVNGKTIVYVPERYSDLRFFLEREWLSNVNY